ncbi:MAG: hypothetical protein BroJett011_07540 [Chloroflexota bacterium]|nr:MAG: hypothetical protein BroJett011_07540 [Chloroflexota bacterium]
MTETNNDLSKFIKSVGLAKLFLWPEAERIQTYPEAFANLRPERVYTRQELVTHVFDLVYKDEQVGRPVRGSHIENCFGLELVSGEKVVIRGLNALRQVGPDKYVATEAALQIGQSYRTETDEDDWAIMLARQLARFEIRTRLLLYLLGQGGWSLVFASPEFYAYPSVRARLEQAGESLALFQDNAAAFNRLLHQHRHVTLGPWWAAELAGLGYELDEGFCFESIPGGVPSTNKLSSALKSSLFLFKYLGILENAHGGWAVSATRAVDLLGAEIATDLVGVPQNNTQNNPLALLKQLADELHDDSGLVVVSHLARRWAGRNRIAPDEADLAFDQFMRQQLYEGAVRITLRHQGQPRHGRGLFGDETARKIKLEFLR